MTFEDLMNTTVTSPGKKVQKIEDVASAITVLTQQDIRRSGATTLPEVLRLVPGVNVSRANSGEWAISIRGFNGLFSTKLLVLIDGRSVYTPLFSGVFWDTQDISLKDIEQIEIIRGPGASIWGANAVNGIVNIITKHSGDTRGGFITAGAGNEERGRLLTRYGTQLSDSLSGRLHAGISARDDGQLITGEASGDDWKSGRGGFRLDYSPTGKDEIAVSGEFARSRRDLDLLIPIPDPLGTTLLSDDPDSKSAYLTGDWTRRHGANSESRLQLHFDWFDHQSSVFGHRYYTYQIDAQHRFAPAENHDLIFGAHYRFYDDKFLAEKVLLTDPKTRQQHLVTAFVQDEIAFFDDNVLLTIGSKFEENSFTGFEIQPNIRTLFRLHEEHSLWLAVSRAVRTPSRFEEDSRTVFAYVPGASGTTSALINEGSDSIDSEVLLAYELGLRGNPAREFQYDIAVFYNDYRDLIRSVRSARKPFPDRLPTGEFTVIPFDRTNSNDAFSYGGEATVTVQPLDQIKFIVGYSFLNIKSLGMRNSSINGRSPEHQLSLGARADLPAALQLDSTLRWVKELPDLNVPGYVELDLRLGWHPSPSWELSVVGQNLLDEAHREWGDNEGRRATEIERGYYGNITYYFP